MAGYHRSTEVGPTRDKSFYTAADRCDHWLLFAVHLNHLCIVEEVLLGIDGLYQYARPKSMLVLTRCHTMLESVTTMRYLGNTLLHPKGKRLTVMAC